MVAQAEIAAYVEEMWRAAEVTTGRPEQWVRLRRRWLAPPQGTRPSVAELCWAYEEATGTWAGD